MKIKKKNLMTFHSPTMENGTRMTILGQKGRNDTIYLTVARCSADEQFSRKKGRKIAKKRMRKNKVVFHYAISKKTDKKAEIQHFIKIAKLLSYYFAYNPGEVKKSLL